tara:strand:- start:704 stop:889 length:186 start_codon:yes stop_codon:yes gene_type:complete
MKKLAEGISDRKWGSYYECEKCGHIETFPLNRPPTIETEYSVHNTPSTTFNINEKDWPDND